MGESVTVDNYQADRYYEKVVSAFDRILRKKSYVTPIDVFLEMGHVNEKRVIEWQKGKRPYFENIIEGNLSKCSRILRLIGFHAHDMHVIPVAFPYDVYVRGTRKRLRFSK